MATAESPIPPEGYFPVGPPFEEEGHSFEAYQPNQADVPAVFHLIARKTDGEVAARREVRMYHDNRFGIDVEDLHNLELATEELIQELRGGG